LKTIGTLLLKRKWHGICKECSTKWSMRWLVFLWLIGPSSSRCTLEISWTQMTLFTPTILFVQKLNLLGSNISYAWEPNSSSWFQSIPICCHEPCYNVFNVKNILATSNTRHVQRPKFACIRMICMMVLHFKVLSLLRWSPMQQHKCHMSIVSLECSQKVFVHQKKTTMEFQYK
jgi:hypothetical protein